MLGFVYGNPDNAVRLLQHEELSLVFPGGAREALRKELYNPYQLQWKKSNGFVKVALQTGSPLVPVAGIGPDDALLVVADHEQTKNSVIGQLLKTIFGNNKYVPAIALGTGLLPLPLPVPFTYYIGKPTYLDYPPEAADDEELTKRLKRNFQKRLERLIQKGLEDRQKSKHADKLTPDN